jgi:hypothetical protein
MIMQTPFQARWGMGRGNPRRRMTWNVLSRYFDEKPFEGQQADA